MLYLKMSIVYVSEVDLLSSEVGLENQFHGFHWVIL